MKRVLPGQRTKKTQKAIARTRRTRPMNPRQYPLRTPGSTVGLFMLQSRRTESERRPNTPRLSRRAPRTLVSRRSKPLQVQQLQWAITLRREQFSCKQKLLKTRKQTLRPSRQCKSVLTPSGPIKSNLMTTTAHWKLRRRQRTRPQGPFPRIRRLWKSVRPS
jgi:hypothetical protein